MPTTIQLKHRRRRSSTLSSGLPRTYIDVGFPPGTSPPATVKRIKEKDNPLIQRCSSSQLDLTNNYPDNSNNFLAHTINRRASRTFKPYVIPKKNKQVEEEALFGPVPTIASFRTLDMASLTSTDATSAFTNNTPPIESSLLDFDFDSMDDEKVNQDDVNVDNNILDDEMVFQELDWITNTMNSTTTTTTNNNNNDLPLSPPLSPTNTDEFSFDNDNLLVEPLDDFILFPSF